jgi:hypothetical protein
MAIIYIMAEDQVGDRRYKLGDIVEILDVGPNGVTKPMPPPFIIIEITDKTAAQIQHFAEEQLDAGGAMLARRLRHLDYTMLTTAQRNYLLTNRYYSTTAAVALTWIRNKLTGGHEA